MAKKLSIPLITLNSQEGNTALAHITQARTKRNIEVQQTVEKILDDIRKNGNKALFGYTKKYDKISISEDTIQIDPSTIEAQAKKVTDDFKTAVQNAAQRIRAYHTKQKIKNSFFIKTPEGFLRQIVKPLNRIGIYVPGGYASYPSTVLMSVIPATIAGVKEIALVSPLKNTIDPAMAYVLKLLHVKEIYRLGGAQAIGALAYGTQSIRAVDKIVGPGNMYVAVAKKYVYGTVDIDSVAGPSEVVILADKTINPSWVALDLLSQAEHGSGDETAICITENRNYAEKVRNRLENEIEKSPVKDIFFKLPPHGITIFVSDSREESIQFINSIAPEHLQIMTKTYVHDVKKINNASAIFLGPYTPVAMGDYYVGTNHILPTAAAARYASPLGVDSFLKRISVAEVNAAGLKKSAPHVALFARSENFIHHALSVERRVKKDI